MVLLLEPSVAWAALQLLEPLLAEMVLVLLLLGPVDVRIQKTVDPVTNPLMIPMVCPLRDYCAADTEA